MAAEAIEIYIQALLDIANALERHREARSAFEYAFLRRVLLDGFLQTVTEEDRERILHHRYPGEECLLWKGPAPHQKVNWNGIGWIFPFTTIEETERAYELVIRSELSQKSWAAFRQIWLSCRLRLHERALEVPTNLVKVRVMGEEKRSVMQRLEQTPPNLRYLVKALLDQLPGSHYLRKRLQLKLVVGEKLEPYVPLKERGRT